MKGGKKFKFKLKTKDKSIHTNYNVENPSNI